MFCKKALKGRVKINYTMTFFSCDRGGLGSGEGLTITKYWKGVALSLSESQYSFFWCFKSNQLTGSLEW